MLHGTWYMSNAFVFRVLRVMYVLGWQNGLDLIPGIGDAGDRLYLGAHNKDMASSADGCNDDEKPSGSF